MAIGHEPGNQTDNHSGDEYDDERVSEERGSAAPRCGLRGLGIRVHNEAAAVQPEYHRPQQGGVRDAATVMNVWLATVAGQTPGACSVAHGGVRCIECCR